MLLNGINFNRINMSGLKHPERTDSCGESVILAVVGVKPKHERPQKIHEKTPMRSTP